MTPPSLDGLLTIPECDGVEIRPGVFLIGEPTPITGTNRLRCLANVDGGLLAVVELSVKFQHAQAALAKMKGA